MAEFCADSLNLEYIRFCKSAHRNERSFYVFQTVYLYLTGLCTDLTALVFCINFSLIDTTCVSKSILLLFLFLFS